MYVQPEEESCDASEAKAVPTSAWLSPVACLDQEVTGEGLNDSLGSTEGKHHVLSLRPTEFSLEVLRSSGLTVCSEPVRATDLAASPTAALFLNWCNRTQIIVRNQALVDESMCFSS